MTNNIPRRLITLQFLQRTLMDAWTFIISKFYRLILKVILPLVVSKVEMSTWTLSPGRSRTQLIRILPDNVHKITWSTISGLTELVTFTRNMVLGRFSATTPVAVKVELLLIVLFW